MCAPIQHGMFCSLISPHVAAVEAATVAAEWADLEPPSASQAGLSSASNKYWLKPALI